MIRRFFREREIGQPDSPILGTIGETEEERAFFQKFNKYIKWGDLKPKAHLFNIEFLEENISKLDQEFVFRNHVLDEQFLRQNIDEIDINKALKYQTCISEQFIRENSNRISSEGWNFVSRYKQLTPEFIAEFKDKVSWSSISQCQTLNEDFIRKFREYVDWNYISQYQPLGEPFIREFRYFVNWKHIIQCQTISDCFKMSLKDFITFQV